MVAQFKYVEGRRDHNALEVVVLSHFHSAVCPYPPTTGVASHVWGQCRTLMGIGLGYIATTSEFIDIFPGRWVVLFGPCRTPPRCADVPGRS